MKRKIFLSVLCMLVLIGVSGCGSKEVNKQVLGTWSGETDSIKEVIVFYENNLCKIEENTNVGEKIIEDIVDKENCKYKISKNKVEIEYVDDYTKRTVVGTFSNDFETLTIGKIILNK